MQNLEKKSITQIEKSIKADNATAAEARKKAIEGLLYLRDSGRFKENKLYRKSSFENYLMGVFNIRYNTFLESARAFSKYPDESVRYGVGLISKVYRNCGAIKERRVIAEIAEADKKAKVPLKRDKIEAIIQKHAKPKPKKNDYKAMYITEVAAHKRTKGQYTDAMKDLKAARNQIEKLKNTIINLRELEPA